LAEGAEIAATAGAFAALSPFKGIRGPLFSDGQHARHSRCSAASRRWVERVQRPLDLLAVIFLVDVILIWSFTDGPPAFLQILNVIAARLPSAASQPQVREHGEDRHGERYRGSLVRRA
jgi:hypothetical protein